GNGGKKVKSRIALIDREIEYTKTLAGKKNIDMDLYRLEKRKNNLLAKVARLFVGGSSEADMTARNLLIEVSIFACKSALKHGYISGGNLAIAKAIYHDINKDDLSELDNIVLELLNDSSKEVFRMVLKNYNRYSDVE